MSLRFYRTYTCNGTPLALFVNSYSSAREHLWGWLLLHFRYDVSFKWRHFVPNDQASRSCQKFVWVMGVNDASGNWRRKRGGGFLASFFHFIS